MRIKAEELGAEIVKAMKSLTKDVVPKINKASKDVAKKYKAALASKSPKRSGKYAKGWKISTTDGEQGIKTVEVHNPKHYRLTHLLEKGHQLRGGGRAKAIPHFIDTEEQAYAEFEKEVEQILDNL